MSGTLITRLFGVFLIAWSLMELPKTVYTTVQGYRGTWEGIVLLGVIPLLIPLICGLIISRWPHLLYRGQDIGRYKFDSALATTAVGLLGLYLLLNGLCDLIFQAGIALLGNREGVRHFDDVEAAANTIASLVQFHIGALVVLFARRIAVTIIRGFVR